MKPFTPVEFRYRAERCLQAAHLAVTAAVRMAAERGEFKFLPSVNTVPRTNSASRSPSTPGELRESSAGEARRKARRRGYLDVPLKRLAFAVDDNYKALHKTPSKQSVQERLVPLEASHFALGLSVCGREGVCVLG